ncbi:hypothetical protein HYV50_00810 [Candidatus Pacearchaeota archaeon]|nr:hypothetical protein [Candidatus Pacearchaeota archaeon]
MALEKKVKIEKVNEALDYFFSLEVPIDDVIEEIRTLMEERFMGAEASSADLVKEMVQHLVLGVYSSMKSMNRNLDSREQENLANHLAMLCGSLDLYLTSVCYKGKPYRNFYEFLDEFKKRMS